MSVLAPSYLLFLVFIPLREQKECDANNQPPGQPTTTRRDVWMGRRRTRAHANEQFIENTAETPRGARESEPGTPKHHWAHSGGESNVNVLDAAVGSGFCLDPFCPSLSSVPWRHRSGRRGRGWREASEARDTMYQVEQVIGARLGASSSRLGTIQIDAPQVNQKHTGPRRPSRSVSAKTAYAFRGPVLVACIRRPFSA